MTRVVVCLFVAEPQAFSAFQRLVDAGSKASDICLLTARGRNRYWASTSGWSEVKLPSPKEELKRMTDYLVDGGIPERDASVFASEVYSGYTLVAVRCNDDEAAKVLCTLESDGAVNSKHSAGTLRQETNRFVSRSNCLACPEARSTRVADVHAGVRVHGGENSQARHVSRAGSPQPRSVRVHDLVDPHGSDSSPEPDKSGLNAREREDALSRSSPRAAVIHEAVRKQGEEEAARPARSLIWSGLAAGLAMGLSLMADGLLRAKMPDVPWRDLVTGWGYTAGFLVVILGRQQLFTENTLTAVLPFLHAFDRNTFGAVARVWSIVLVTNLVGTLVFAAGAGLTDIFDEKTREAFLEIGRDAAEPGFWTTFLRAVMAGWLIALMVWLLPAAGSARFFVVLAMTYLIAIGNFAHVIAGSAEVAYAAVVGGVGWDEYALGFLLPALLGNILGGLGSWPSSTTPK